MPDPDPAAIASAFKTIGTIKGTAKALGIDRKTVRKYIGNPNQYIFKKTDKRSGLTRLELMTKYDDATRARDAIRRGINKLMSNLPANPDADEILDESQFRSEMCDGVVSQSFKRVAAEPEFRKYRFAIGEKLFWSSPRTKEWALKNISKSKEVID